MTGTIAGTSSGFGTLSLPSMAGSFFHHTIQIQLMPLTGSSGSGASSTVTVRGRS